MLLQVYIEAVLSQYINDQQQVSNLTLLWDGGGPDYMTEEILHEVNEGGRKTCYTTTKVD